MQSPAKYLALIAACAVVLFLAIPRNAPTPAKSASPGSAVNLRSGDNPAAAIAPTSPPPVPDRIAIAPKSSARPRATIVIAPVSTRSSAKKQAEPEPPPIEPLIPHDVAREALGDVGFDAEAEIVWTQAINDPALSNDQRRNLIEDLNEDGFPDPKNITFDDIPLIQNRMKLIEQLAPSAMDQVNSDAFDEAYKDLSDMLKRLGRS